MKKRAARKATPSPPPQNSSPKSDEKQRNAATTSICEEKRPTETPIETVGSRAEALLFPQHSKGKADPHRNSRKQGRSTAVPSTLQRKSRGPKKLNCNQEGEDPPEQREKRPTETPIETTRSRAEAQLFPQRSKGRADPHRNSMKQGRSTAVPSTLQRKAVARKNLTAPKKEKTHRSKGITAADKEKTHQSRGVPRGKGGKGSHIHTNKINAAHYNQKVKKGHLFHYFNDHKPSTIYFNDHKPSTIYIKDYHVFATKVLQ